MQIAQWNISKLSLVQMVVHSVAFHRLMPMLQVIIFLGFYSVVMAEEDEHRARIVAIEASQRYESVKQGGDPSEPVVGLIDTPGWHQPVSPAIQMGVGSFLPSALPAVAVGLAAGALGSVSGATDSFPTIMVALFTITQLVTMWVIGCALDSKFKKLSARKPLLETGVGIYLLLSPAFGIAIAHRVGSVSSTNVHIINAWSLFWLALGVGLLLRRAKKFTAPA